MDALKSGEKTFEVRRDDRGFQKGDILVLHRYGHNPEKYRQPGYMNVRNEVVSGYAMIPEVDKFEAEITYVLTGGQFGIAPGYVVLGLRAREVQGTYDNPSPTLK